MSSLHELIYQMVSNPRVMTDFGQNSQELVDTFNLSHNEVVALQSVITDRNSLQNLLSLETLKQTAEDLGLNAWIQPST